MKRKSTNQNISEGVQTHPYEKYVNTELWDIIKKSIKDLENNQDISLMTPPEYVVGYICQQLEKAQLIRAKIKE